MSKILVTGGAGYIGSHACKALAAAGFTPVTYDNLVYGHDWAVKWGPLEIGDIRDEARLAEVLAKHRPMAVMHFAAFAYVGESVADPAQYYLNNVVGTLSLLEAMRAHAVDRIVFSSTCATYGTPEAVPITEDSPQRPINPYGASKLMVEQILADYGSAYGVRSVALRYFNAAGADPDGEIGEDHDPEPHLIPRALEAAADGEPVTIFGNDYDTPDGTCIRDYIHVTDLAEAHVRALMALDGREGFCAYNLGTGAGVSVAEVIDAVGVAVGREVPTCAGDRRPGDPAVLVADISRAQAELAWRPRLSNLQTMALSAWRWRNRGKNLAPILAGESA